MPEFDTHAVATLARPAASPPEAREGARDVVAHAPLRRALFRDISPDTPRRIVNVTVALLGLLLALPLMLLIALLIKCDSRGPVFYKQPRVGLDRRRQRWDDDLRRAADLGGRIFTIYKFRTMTPRSETGGERWASAERQRVTRVGRFLRATRLDEVPQLVNVLKGDMNIVGPRPEQPTIFAELRAELNGYHERQRVLPGITGLAQVNLGYDTSVDDVKKKVALDLAYIDRRSAAEDLVIMAKTMPVMVFRKGAM